MFTKLVELKVLMTELRSLTFIYVSSFEQVHNRRRHGTPTHVRMLSCVRVPHAQTTLTLFFLLPVNLSLCVTN
jgi:hypothetical protein